MSCLSLDDLWIPQLAFSAKLLCLLMVVICGAVPSMVRSVRLHNDCSSSELRVNMQGKVYAADEPENDFNNLTLQSISFDKLTIFAERPRRFLCFTRGWKLVGSKKFRGKRCEFEEAMENNGFNRYRSVANRNYSLGFNPKGLPLRGPRTVGVVGGRKGKGLEKCTYFLKCGVNLSQTIIEHNRGDHPGPMRLGQLGSFGKSILGPSSVDNKLKKKNPKKSVQELSPSLQTVKHPQRHKNKNHLRYS